MQHLPLACHCLTIAVIAGAASADVAVSVNPAVQYQTIQGWGASSWLTPKMTPELRAEVLREAVNDLGLTRLRLEPPAGNFAGSRRWEWENDNGDPEDIHWPALNTTPLDQLMTNVILPFRQMVEANGEPFQVYVSPSFFNGGSSGSVPPWLFNSPGEYAEYAASILLYLRDTHGLVPNYYCILNEAGNDNAFWETVLATMIKVVGPRFQTLGLPTRIQFPEAISANTSWSIINALRNDTVIWPYIGLLTYHLYGTNDPHRSRIRDFGVSRGIPTGQTEYLNLTMKYFYDDLTLGGVSVWEIYGMDSQIRMYYDRLQRETGQYWNFRQIMRYVRPGAVRISATSNDANLLVLAFRRSLQTTVVLINGVGARVAIVSGLEEGDYTVSFNVAAGPASETGVRHVAAGGTLTVDVPSEAVMTIHPYAGANQPPTPTIWRADREYVTLPESGAQLTASANDPELDPIGFNWSVTKQPAGATAVLATPNAATTEVSGLNVAGDYAFTIAVSDPTHMVTREVRLRVFAENQPPVLTEVHNRNPVLLTLPQSSTTLRSSAWDLEGDAIAYQWRILSQPAGANALLQTPSTAACVASNMTVAGDYVFEVSASDAMQTVSKTLTVPVYPVNTAPVIHSLTAAPQPACAGKAAELTAVTSDPDNDVISHWWTLVSAPSGATPVIARRGAATTRVTGLSVPGNYIFSLVVVDRTLMASNQVTLSVVGAPCGADINADGSVNAQDFDLLAASYGLVLGQSGYNPNADANHDGLADDIDYQHWLWYYREAVGDPQASAPFEVLGDFQRDGHVDQLDFSHFQACVTGAEVPQLDQGCGDADLDTDGDVDPDDFGLFQRCITGGDGPLDLGCKY